VLVLLVLAALLSFGALRHQAVQLEIIHGDLGFPMGLGELSAHTLAGFWALALKLLTVVGILGLRNRKTRDWRSWAALLIGLGLDIFFQTRGYDSHLAGFAAAVPPLALAMAIWIFEVPTLRGRGKRRKRQPQDRAVDEGAAGEAGHAMDVRQPPSGVEPGQPAQGPASPPPPKVGKLSHRAGTVIDRDQTVTRQPRPPAAGGRVDKREREAARRAYRADKPVDRAAADTGIDQDTLAAWWSDFERLYGPQANGDRSTAGT
jgi:hypothetical protein